MSGKGKLAGDILGIKRKHPSIDQVKNANVKNQEKHKDCPRMCKLFQQATDILLLPRTSLLGFDNFENISTYSKISKMKNGKIYYKEKMEEIQDMKKPKMDLDAKLVKVNSFKNETILQHPVSFVPEQAHHFLHFFCFSSS